MAITGGPLLSLEKGGGGEDGTGRSKIGSRGKGRRKRGAHVGCFGMKQASLSRRRRR